MAAKLHRARVESTIGAQARATSERLSSGRRCRNRVRAVAAGMLAALVMTVAGVVTSHPLRALAWSGSGTVNIQMGDWDCHNGGHLTFFHGLSIDNGGTVGPTGGSRVTTWSALGGQVHITASYFCKTGWFGGYDDAVYYVPRWFSFSGQTTYI